MVVAAIRHRSRGADDGKAPRAPKRVSPQLLAISRKILDAAHFLKHLRGDRAVLPHLVITRETEPVEMFRFQAKDDEKLKVEIEWPADLVQSLNGHVSNRDVRSLARELQKSRSLTPLAVFARQLWPVLHLWAR